MKSLFSAVSTALSNGSSRVALAPRFNGSGLLSGFMAGDREAQLRAMAALGDVYAIVSLISSYTAKTKWHLYRQSSTDGRRRYATSDHGDDQRVEVTKHAALDQWNRPNPFFTKRSFVQGQQQHLELTGEGYWVFQTAGSQHIPLNMFYVRPDRMEPIPDPDKFLAGYIYTDPNGNQVPLQTWECIGPPSLAFPNPWDMYHGLGPLQSVLVDIQAAKFSVTWNRNFFYNNASPGGVIQVGSVDKPIKWSDTDFDEFTDRWRETHKGVSAAGAIAILENGATWQPNQMSMRDMQFAELRGVTGNNVRRAWRVHPSMLGDVEDVNRANAETAQEAFTRDIVVDRLDILKDVLNGPYLTMFGAENDVEFDYEDPVPDNREADNEELIAKCQAAQMLIGSGFDPGAVLEAVGLPDMPLQEVKEIANQPAPAQPPAIEAPPSDAGSNGDDDLANVRNGLKRLADLELKNIGASLAKLNGYGHKVGAK